MDSKYSLIENTLNGSIKNGSFNGFTGKHKILNGSEISTKKFKTTEDSNAHEKNIINRQVKSRDDNLIKIQEQRKNLPAYLCKEKIINEIHCSCTTLIMGETGSGKTTQIPQLLYKAGYTKFGMIAITQPRRVAAITVAKRVAQEIGCQLGDTVGFTVRFEDCTNESTKIRFMTDGSLLREALSDRLLMKYSVIILDEVHERTINSDVLLGIVKEAQEERSKKKLKVLKIVITSATMDIDNFSKYFGVKGIYLEGRMYPVRVFHVKEPQKDYLHACLVTVFQIHRIAPINHDVLMFLTGQEEIETMAAHIRKINKSDEMKTTNLRVFPLYSQMPQHKQLECFLPFNSKFRRIILSTNIAETSITIPGIKYIIDSGYVKRRVYNPLTNVETLKVVKISQAQSWQRCGRAGRESEGFCYRTYTVDEMKNFEEMPVPEILRSNLLSTLIQLLAMNIDCSTFDFLDKPKPESIKAGYQHLYFLNAIKSVEDLELTAVGKTMALFPLDPRLSKLLLTGESFQCLEEMLSIVAILSGENIFVTNTEKREKAALAHAKFQSSFGDHLTLLNVFKAFEKQEKIKIWCHDNYLNSRNLLYAKDVRKQLEDICKKCKMVISSCDNNLDQVRKCLLAGIFNNIAELQSDHFYLTISGRQRAKIHPSSVLSGKSRPQLIIFSELVSTERNFLRTITAIEPSWISETIPNYPYINRIKCVSC